MEGQPVAAVIELRNRLLTAYGQDLLDRAVDYFAKELDAICVSIGSLRVAEYERIHLHAAYYKHGELDIREYDASHTPCHIVSDQGQVVTVLNQLQDVYPRDNWFKKFNLNAYVGVPLFTPNGISHGLIIAEWEEEIDQDTADRAIQLFSALAPRISEYICSSDNRDILQAIGSGESHPEAKKTFRYLAKMFAKALGLKAAFIAENVENDPDQFRILAYHLGDHALTELEGLAIDYETGPCDNVRRDSVFLMRDDLQQNYNSDIFKSQGINAYVGFAIHDDEGRVVGHVAGLHDRALAERILESALLTTLRNRIRLEILRYRSEMMRSLAEAALAHRSKVESIGLLAGSMAHNINNSLASMIGHSEFVQDSLPNNHPALLHLDKVETSILSVKSMISDVLGFIAGAETRPEAPADLNDIIDNAAALIVPVRQAWDQLELNLDPSITLINGNKNQLLRVVSNLLINAIDAMHQRPGKIYIETAQTILTDPMRNRMILNPDDLPQNCVTLRISDQGIGMNRETLSRIFDPFFSANRQGRGLGMTAIHGILESHRAAISIDSDIDQGTDITIYFPVLDQLPSASSTKTNITRTVENHHREWILVIDDQEEVLESISGQLRSIGYTVTGVQNCEKAIEKLQNTPGCAAAFIDIHMPDCNGWEGCEKLHSVDAGLPVIVISGNSVDFPENINTNIVGYLQKPFRRAQLKHTLENLLGVTQGYY